MVRVVKTEEKGSDVNLACHLVADAFEKKCDAAFVISNDSDLLEPIRIARQHGNLISGCGIGFHDRPAGPWSNTSHQTHPSPSIHSCILHRIHHCAHPILHYDRPAS